VKASVEEGSPFAEIEVSDTGIGIPVHRREFLFQKFSQADASMTRKYGGSGLGLVIVKELVEMMGGEVTVDSAGENQGTTVRISIARAGSADTEGEAARFEGSVGGERTAGAEGGPTERPPR
jgi:signal transduction histidine kinase